MLPLKQVRFQLAGLNRGLLISYEATRPGKWINFLLPFIRTAVLSLFLASCFLHRRTVGAIAQTPFSYETEPITAEHVEGLSEPWILNLCGLCALRGEMAEIMVWAKNKAADRFSRKGYAGKPDSGYPLKTASIRENEQRVGGLLPRLVQ